MKSSSLATANKAGIKQFLTCLIGARSKMSNFAFDLMVFLTNFKAPLTRNDGIFVYDFASSFTSYFMSEKGLSSTIPAMLGSLSPYRRAVTEPIDLPQRPMVDTRLFFLK